MMQGSELAIASIVVACISVVVAAVLSVFQLRNRNETRRAQLFMELYNQFYTPEFHRRWMEIVFVLQDENLLDSEGIPSFLKGEIDNYVEVNALCCFFEGIGLLVDKTLIDIHIVAELMSTPIIYVWEKVQKFVMQTREILGRPQVYEWFEYLYQEIQSIPSRKSQQPIQSQPNP